VIELSPELLRALPPNGAFDHLLNIPGKVHREVRNRRTVEFTSDGRRYFIKAQRGCGWGEILKNIFSARLPIVSARTEWLAIESVRAAGIPTMSVAGRGLRGVSPAALESFVITDALDGMVSLEELTAKWNSLPPRIRVRLKRALIGRIADIARRLHGAGMNHRDFYLCHFLVRDRDWTAWNLGDELELFLIDLHRVQRRAVVPERWLVKDLGGLLFSALDAGITRRDLLRFLRVYRRDSWRESLQSERALWKRVGANAVNLYRPFHRREPPLAV
jgi:heptose I phosphotransferase